MCRLSINVDEGKRDLAKKYLNDYGLSMTEAISIFLDAVIMNKGMPNADALEDAEDIMMATKEDNRLTAGKSTTHSAKEVYARLVKKKVESDPDDTVYHFDNAEDAMRFLDYATR